MVELFTVRNLPLSTFQSVWGKGNVSLEAAPQSDRRGLELELELPITNILLMGQFNFNPNSASGILDWVNVWSKFFANIVVTGPFDDRIVFALEEHQQSAGKSSFSIHVGRDDRGFVSPYESLTHWLLQYQNSSSIHAVLYMHDDFILNVTYLWEQGALHPPALPNNIWGTFPQGDFGDAYYITTTHRRRSGVATTSQNQPERDSISFALPTKPMGNQIGPSYDFNENSLLEALPKWPNHQRCLRSRIDMLHTHRAYLDNAGYAHVTEQQYNQTEMSANITTGTATTTRQYYFPSHFQSDVLLVPTAWARDFAHAAQPNIQNQVFLECAVPTILEWMKTKQQEQEQEIRKDEVNESGKLPPLSSSVTTGLQQTKVSGADNPSLRTGSLLLCTSWDNNIRTRDDLLMVFCRNKILETAKVFGGAHPLKISRVGLTKYTYWVDWMQQYQ